MNLFFCLNCFSRLDRDEDLCPHCGKSTRVQNKQNQLGAGSILRGRYLTGRALGEGGFGITYMGYDLKTNRAVAIKEFYPAGKATRTGRTTIMPSQQYDDFFRQEREKFINEARILAQFQNEAHIVHVWDFFIENNTAYTVMEYLKGVDLSVWQREHGPQPFDEVFRMMEPIMQALTKVHSKGLIHRDISPSNLMLLEDGTVKLLDFGTTRAQSVNGERSLSVMLKPGFAPEEQYRRRGQQGAWTDVYAFCATMYKLITGFSPEPATDRVMHDQLLPPSARGAKITPEQESVLMKGLAVRSEDRWQSMEELRAAFAANIVVKPPIKPPIKKMLAGAAAVLALAIVGGVLLFSGEKKVEGMPVEKYLVVQENWYSEDGTLDHQVFHEYNKYGGETLSHYVSEGYEERTEREYDDNGGLVSYTYEIGESYFHTEYTADGSRTYDRDRNLTRYDEYITEGDKSTTYTYYPDGTVMHYSIHELQKNGDSVLRLYDGEGKKIQETITVVTETAEGRVETSTTNLESGTSVSVKTYDENGRLRREEYTDVYSSEVREYGEDGRATLAVNTVKVAEETVFRGEFEYELREILVPKGSA